MRHHNTLLHAILKPMPWGRFDRLVDKHGADKGVRRLSTRSQLLALIHAQLSGAVSLREIEATISSHRDRLYHLGAVAPRRSTLADANRIRPADLFVHLFQSLLAQAHPGLRRAAREAVRLIDSTSMRLNGLSRSWASGQVESAGAKLHVVFDPDAQVPVHFAVTGQRINDITVAKMLPIEAGATYVFDLGYYDFSWWNSLISKGCRVVTRLKTNTRTTIIRERSVAPGGPVLTDRIVRLPTRLAASRTSPCASDMRELTVVIPTGKTLRIVSNDLVSPAETIADLYKTRWQIELFFRWVKQTLKIKKFLGTSENAVRVQLAVALIAYLLLKIAHAAQTTIQSPLTFARLTRSNLMHRTTIGGLAAPPLRPAPQTSQQLGFAL